MTKLKQSFRISVIFMSLLANGPAFAQAIPEFSKFLEEQFSQIETSANLAQSANEAVCASSEQEATEAPEIEEDWYLRNVYIRLRPQFGVTVSGFSKFQIVPEIETLVQRPFAAGWKAYKPVSAQ
jgi:hypothetical protein